MGYSIVRSHLDGKHPFMKNIRSNRTYFLLKGNAQFHVENEIIDLTDNYEIDRKKFLTMKQRIFKKF